MVMTHGVVLAWLAASTVPRIIALGWHLFRVRSIMEHEAGVRKHGQQQQQEGSKPGSQLASICKWNDLGVA